VADVSFASLSPTLLARKGGAKPAMRPQHAALASMTSAEPMAEPAPEHLEDLGWNDMGDGETATASAEVFQLTPMSRVHEETATETPRPVVREQQEQLAERIVAAPKRVPAASRTGRAAFTLRLDADRHLKLRLATTIKGISAQALVTEALDTLLGRMPELDTLAAQVKRH
jgi:hypothetical protein